MGVPLIRGRLFTLQDNSTAVTVAVVDKQFARLYFGDKDPLGKRINLVWLGTSPTIVGIVGNVKQHGLDEGAQSPSDAELYVPIAQMPDQLISNVSKGAAVVVRGKGKAKTEIAGIERVLLGSYGDVLIDGVDSMDHIVSDSLAPRQFLMTLLTVFAGLALLLACTGIYAVISYITLQRSREIGVRLALGAKKAHILRMVLRQGIVIAITGIGGGVLIALAMMWVMSRMLFGVSARDPFTIIAVSLLLLAVSIAATFVPAWRATRVDPVVSLRHQ
jgi:putative ABC transport system permease protein